MNAVTNTDEAPLKLDLGCGKNKKEGFIGVDRKPFEGVDVVVDLLQPWPWKDNSVDEINMQHALEHFTGEERVHILNEMYRVLVKDGKATISTPHWCSSRAYGDFTHKWPPVGEMFYFYLLKKWRMANSPDNDIEWNPKGYSCNFEVTMGHTIHQEFVTKHQDKQMYALQFYKEAAQDLIATLVAKK
jgi:ubiquinone/menaquinone biosynthesis C-methylase UbiE